MPARKVTGSLLGLIDSDMEDETQLTDDVLQSPQVTAPSAANDVPKSKATKSKPKANKVTKPRAPARNASATTVKNPTGRKPAGRKPSAAKKKALEEQVNGPAIENEGDAEGDFEQSIEFPAGGSDVENEPSGQRIDVRGKKAGAKKTIVDSKVTQDGELEYAPTTERRSKQEVKPKGRAKKPAVVMKPSMESVNTHQAVPELQADAMDVDETYNSAEDDEPAKFTNRTSSKQTVIARTNSRQQQAVGIRRRAGSVSDSERGDPTLRRKLGDLTKKFENVDLKYRNLREVGITEANNNMDKLRKQCDTATLASNELIASLKTELAAKCAAAQEGRTLRTKLNSSENEVTKLQTQISDMSALLSNAQNEIKGLRAKLTATRAASVETVSSKGLGSTRKNTNGQTRTMMVGSAEAPQAAQVAQLKEDLYSDLTGLIIRGVKRTEDGDMYDCVQTGRNGTLHFKLTLVQDEGNKGASFEDAEYEYLPLLDENRDRDLLELMPDYLTEDITFSRRHAAQFYSRVTDTLIKKRPEE